MGHRSLFSCQGNQGITQTMTLLLTNDIYQLLLSNSYQQCMLTVTYFFKCTGANYMILPHWSLYMVLTVQKGMGIQKCIFQVCSGLEFCAWMGKNNERKHFVLNLMSYFMKLPCYATGLYSMLVASLHHIKQVWKNIFQELENRSGIVLVSKCVNYAETLQLIIFISVIHIGMLLKPILKISDLNLFFLLIRSADYPNTLPL